MDSSDFTLPHSGSRLLSEQDLFSQNQDDLSLSDLSITDHQPRQNIAGVHRRPFSLLAQPNPQRKPLFSADNVSAIADEEEEYQYEEDEEEERLDRTVMTMAPEDAEARRREAAKTREEKLHHDLFILRKLNAAFGVYKDALRATKSSTERVAEQLEHTDALLNKYMNILAKSDKVTQLMLDERWQGAEADEETLKREHQAHLERLKREEEERVLAEQREQERLAREEQERKDREEREEKERLAKEKAAEVAAAKRGVSRGSGVSGVRGTRASMRGMAARGAASTRGAAVTRGGSAIPTPATRGGIPVRRPTSSASARPSSRGGIPRKATRD